MLLPDANLDAVCKCYGYSYLRVKQHKSLCGEFKDRFLADYWPQIRRTHPLINLSYHSRNFIRNCRGKSLVFEQHCVYCPPNGT